MLDLCCNLLVLICGIISGYNIYKYKIVKRIESLLYEWHDKDTTKDKVISDTMYKILRLHK
jgi:hypothetical protein